MADQDAQDINQMMPANEGIVLAAPKKSKFGWLIVGCVMLGVGLGIFVYQQSVKTPAKPVSTTKPVVKVVPSPTEVAIVPDTNAVTPSSVTQPLPATMTFPETGKLRVYSNLGNLQLLITITSGSKVNTITLPARPVSATTPMNYTDATFEVTAGTVASISANLNKATGPKMGGWILPLPDNKCGVTAFMDIAPALTWLQKNLATGKTVFAKQCWSDEINPKDPTSYDFNDFFLAWSYAGATASSPTPTPSAAASVSPSASPSPSPSRAASPSPSAAASVTPTPSPTPTPTPSARVLMPDTSGGTPVTGIFEVTVGTISIGLILLILGLLGLLVL